MVFVWVRVRVRVRVSRPVLSLFLDGHAVQHSQNNRKLSLAIFEDIKKSIEAICVQSIESVIRERWA